MREKEINNLHSISVCLQMVGLAKGALESVIPYLHEREAFSQKIADFQVSIHCVISLVFVVFDILNH